MIRKFLLKLLIHLYLQKNRSIYKLSPENELNKFMFSKPEDVIDIMRAFLTNQTLMFWEAKSEYERNIIKGSGLILRLLQDLHNTSLKINKEIKNPETRIKEWLKIKYKLLGEITNQKTR